MTDRGVGSWASLTFQVRRVLVHVVNSRFMVGGVWWVFCDDVPGMD